MVQNKCTDENIRDIRIYWKDVASDLKHGIITRFMVDIFIEEPHRKRHVTASSVHGNSYNYLASISCDSDYEIRLRAATSIGVSSDYSALFIPRINIDYQDVIQDVIPVIANNSFHVYWLNKSGTNTSLSDDYRVFWCYKDIENRCKSPINWREVSEKQTYGNVPEQAVSVPEQAGSVAHRYRFGIGYFETGIKWSRCLYTQTEDSQPPVGLNLVAYKSSAVGSMTIYWDNLPCESHPPSPYIDQFIVTICKLKDKEKTLCQDKPVTKTVNGGRKNFAFNNLDTGTMYLVCVQSQGLSRHHLGPKNCISGQSASLRTIPFHPAIITLIVLCSVVVVSVITCGVVKLLRTNKKDFKITVPASFRESDQELLSRGTRLSEYLPLTDYQRHQTSSNSSLDT